MILFYGLLGLFAAPFVVLAIGIWMCFILLKVSFIVIVALGCFVIGLVRAIAEHRRRVKLHDGEK